MAASGGTPVPLPGDSVEKDINQPNQWLEFYDFTYAYVVVILGNSLMVLSRAVLRH